MFNNIVYGVAKHCRTYCGTCDGRCNRHVETKTYLGGAFFVLLARLSSHLHIRSTPTHTHTPSALTAIFAPTLIPSLSHIHTHTHTHSRTPTDKHSHSPTHPPIHPTNAYLQPHSHSYTYYSSTWTSTHKQTHTHFTSKPSLIHSHTRVRTHTHAHNDVSTTRRTHLNCVITRSGIILCMWGQGSHR